MKIKLDFITDYKVTDKAVVCLIRCVKEDNFIEQLKLLGWQLDFKSVENLSVNPVFKGVARLKEDDISNINIASDIARNKAMRSIYKYYNNLINDIMEELYSRYEEFNGELIERIAHKTRTIFELVDLTERKEDK